MTGCVLAVRQMFQFVTMMAQAAYCWRFSPYPKPLSKLLFFYMQTLLALFAHFYVQKYLSGGKRGPELSGKAGGALETGALSAGKASGHANGHASGQANGHADGDYTIAAAGKKAC